MDTKIIKIIARELGLSDTAVSNTIVLLSEGATIPFISRYRKERTGSLDEVQILKIKELSDKFNELGKRKATVLKSVEEQNALTPQLRNRITECINPLELEDIYLPYKPKRHTKAMIAKERGLEPLAKIIMKQQDTNPASRAASFLNEEVKTAGEALSGARDIITEWINENEKARNIVRREFKKNAFIFSKVIKGKEEAAEKYRDYHDWKEPLGKCPSHRLLAMRRGEKEKLLHVIIKPDSKQPLDHLNRFFVKDNNECSRQVASAVKVSYNRLMEPSIETEFANISKEKADKEAISVFAENLRQLLLAPPLGQKRIMAVDPGYRTGCKIVCLDEKGDLLHNETIYPHKPQQEIKLAAKKIHSLANAYNIEAIAIGNGTASRETEFFIKRLRFDRDMEVYIVNEDGASVYSASSIARQEFPQYDVTVRGAVSIGRRLMDPLAELVKIDPKNIGVGQYQHDVNQKYLKKSLDAQVEICVNAVGVNVNTASRHLLAYISGLGPRLAQNIVEYRKNNGSFRSREELKKVPLMGARSYEQSAGFLRIQGGDNPLDNSAVHPEAYDIVRKMAFDLKCELKDLLNNERLVSLINLEKYISDKAGLPTLKDIKNELIKQGRDPRKQIKIFEFDRNILSIDDLKEGMVLPGIINNITRFGAFVDIGIKQSGLIHVSEMADRFVSDPNEIVRIHQHVKVKVLDIDIPRKRIQLSLKLNKQWS